MHHFRGTQHRLRGRDAEVQFVRAALGKEVREHLGAMSEEVMTKKGPAYLNGIKRAPGTLGVELYTPDLLARLSGRLDTLDRRVIAVDEERLPARRERILQLERILVVLTRMGD